MSGPTLETPITASRVDDDYDPLIPEPVASAAPTVSFVRRATGPISAAVKATASRNATTYGIHSDRPVLQGIELPEEWETHRRGVLESIAPATPLEEALAGRIALLLWRLRRVVRYETEVTNLSLEESDRDAAIMYGSRVSFSGPGSQFPGLDSLLGRPDVLREKHAELTLAVEAFESLERLPDNEVVPEARVLAILEAVARVMDVSDDRVQAARKAGLASATEWIRSRLGRALSTLAGPAGGLDTLIPRARSLAKSELAHAATLLQGLEREARAITRQRLLHPGPELDRVVKYETHLHRLLVSTLRELEAMQRRRQGDPTPLGRIDLSGDASSHFPWTHTASGKDDAE